MEPRTPEQGQRPASAISTMGSPRSVASTLALARAPSPAEASLDSARRQADAIAAEANRKLRTLSLGATPTQTALRPAGTGTAASSLRSPIRDLITQNSAEMRLALASRRHADSSAAAARVGSSPRSSSPRSSPRAEAVSQHALSARDNWGASPRALEHREAMMSQVASSPRSPTDSRGAFASSGLASPHSRSAGPGSPRMTPTTEVEAHHHWAVYSAQRDLSQSLRQAVGVAASPTAFRSDHEPERRQHRYMDPYRPGGPAGVISPGNPQASAKIAALQAKADLAANKLANMLPARPMDAGAPLGYSHYSTTAASGSPRPIRQTGVGTPKAATHFVGSPARRSTDTSFSSEMARSPGATLWPSPCFRM